MNIRGSGGGDSYFLSFVLPTFLSTFPKNLGQKKKNISYQHKLNLLQNCDVDHNEA